jgi:predicted TIM-barrel fold metal-dependent hydrolase
VTTVDGFDVHHHFGPVPGWDQGPGAPELERDLDVRLAAMDRFGIAQACLMPSHSYARPRGTDDLRALNDAVARLRKGAPDRFPVALGTTDLWLGADTVDEARRVLDDLGLDGLSWHHRLQGAYIDDARMHAVLDLLAERGKVAFVHVFAESTFESPWRLENLTEAHRDVTFVALDAFSSYDQSCWMGRLATHHPNLWFDTAAMATNASLLARFVAEAGVERLLLGTNCYGAAQPDFHPAAIDLVCASNELSDAEKDAILGGNARHLFGLAGAGA